MGDGGKEVMNEAGARRWSCLACQGKGPICGTVLIGECSHGRTEYARGSGRAGSEYAPYWTAAADSLEDLASRIPFRDPHGPLAEVPRRGGTA